MAERVSEVLSLTRVTKRYVRYDAVADTDDGPLPPVQIVYVTKRALDKLTDRSGTDRGDYPQLITITIDAGGTDA